MTCQHSHVTVTAEKGPHCCDCGELLAGIFNAVPRNTVLGQLIWQAKQERALAAKNGMPLAGGEG